MADDTTQPETPEAAPKLPRRKASATQAESAVPPVPEPAAADAPTPPEAPAPEWLRYTGQTATVFMDLGGEIEPGQIVRPRDAALAELLLQRSDFEPAEAPTPAAASDGTAN